MDNIVHVSVSEEKYKKNVWNKLHAILKCVYFFFHLNLPQDDFLLRAMQNKIVLKQ